ncbi:phosphate-starvation-inducible E [Glaciecola punicea]|jgi:protein PsiE|uniref:phosphate-starvation-inducible protein PsiE n=1 Tax=Glaciecola punicea TaxID=56804 RepID=UPI0008732BC4|nr:phosphate-starvation-inducible PsiE family protein [Glaciecola punicea]OFA32871.1 phosphate-starvation-inducible E [Glaciecola punicea]
MTSKKQNDNDANTKEDSAKVVDGPDPSEKERSVVLGLFSIIERILLFFLVVLTLGGVGFEIQTIFKARTIILADILLMFLYLEVIAMVAVFYSDRNSVFVYPIFIAITALARLIILQGKDMDPQNILYEAVAILVLAIAIVVLLRMRKS